MLIPENDPVKSERGWFWELSAIPCGENIYLYMYNEVSSLNYVLPAALFSFHCWGFSLSSTFCFLGPLQFSRYLREVFRITRNSDLDLSPLDYKFWLIWHLHEQHNIEQHGKPFLLQEPSDAGGDRESTVRLIGSILYLPFVNRSGLSKPYHR